MVERIKKLCSDNKTSVKALERELGFGNGTIRRWNENTPSVERIVAVANYFNVPISYLTGWDDAISSLTNAGMSEIDVAEEMGIDPAILSRILSEGGYSSSAAILKFSRVASLLSEENKKPATETGSGQIPNYSELSKENQDKVAEYVALLLNAQRNQ